MSGTDAPAPDPRPSRIVRFLVSLADRPRFVLPLLVLTLSALVYVEIAVRKAFPYVVPALLDRTLLPESELRANLHRAFRTASLLVPVAAMTVTAVLAWATLVPLRRRPSFPAMFSLVAWASVPVSVGLLVKAALALATGHADPPVNLGAFTEAGGAAGRAALALTNPFGWLAAAIAYAGLRAWGITRAGSVLGGALPWAAWMAGIAIAFGGSARFTPSAPVPTDDWPEIAGNGITLRYPPGADADAKALLDLASGFSDRMRTRLSIRPHDLRIHVYPDHAALERATGEMLHVLVTGSIRGTDLLYLEMPGHSPALTRENALREALRWVALVRLAPAAGDAPRWFVEGFVHAAVHPGTKELDRRFRAVLRRDGIPGYERMLDPALFRTPEGPLLARSLVDHLAFVAGKDAPERIMKAVVKGTAFRDALFETARLTSSALEAGWTEGLRNAAGGPQGSADADSATPPAGRPGSVPDSTAVPAPGAPPDTSRLDDVAPFLRGS